MKRFIQYGVLGLALVFCSVASARFLDPHYCGLYVGIQPGFADLNYNKAWLTNQSGFTSVSSVDNAGFAGRVFAGFDFNKYLAAELGYVYLPDVTFKHINASTTNKSFRQQIADVSAKVTLPLNKYFAVYGRAGMAWVYRNDIKATLYATNLSTNIDNEKFTPVFGGGLKFNFNENFSVDIAYARYLKRGDLYATDFYGIGFAYKFI